MRSIIHIIFLCLSAGNVNAQQSVKLSVVEKPTRWLESNINENKEIVVEASGIISQVEIDSVKNILYAVITPEVNNKKQNFNYLIAYDLIEGRELWIREIIPENKFLMIDTMPAVSGKGSALFYPINGKEMWSSTAKLYHFSKKTKTILGYDLEAKKLVGMEFLTGKIIWHDFMPDRNLKSLLFLGDTGMVIMGHYPQFYDLLKGKVGNTDEKIRSYLNANDSTPDAGIRLALHINYLSKLNSIQSQKTLGHQLSNFLIHEGEIFIASGNSVFAFSLSGDLRWQHQLPHAIYGRCKIFYHNEAIYVVNYGQVPYENYYYGNVFIGLLDINTGGGKISAKINQIDQTYIKDFLLTDSSMIAVFNNSMKEIALDDLRIMNDHPFNNPHFSSGFRHLAPPPYYILTNDTLQNRSAKDPKLIFVENNNGLKIELSEDYYPQDVIPKSRFFYPGQKSEHYSVLYNDTRVLITNDSLQMYPIRFSHNMFNAGGYFCDWDENRMIIIPEKSVMEWLQRPK